MEPDGIYYRVLHSRDGKAKIIEMQWHDEYDYDHTRYLTDEKFETKEEAQNWIDAELVRCIRLLPILMP